MRRLLLSCLLLPLLATTADRASAQDPAPLYDPGQLPAFSGTVQLFTLTPRGEIDGFVLEDGTEVKTPPHLTLPLSAAIRPGDAVTIHGLKAASLPLIQAMSVMNVATGRTVVDVGPEAGDPGPPRPPSMPSQTQSVSVAGRVRMALHGPRGDVNGVLLEDGTMLKLPPPEAARFSDLLVMGRPIAAQGLGHATSTGRVVELTAVGPSADRMMPVRQDAGPRPPV